MGPSLHLPPLEYWRGTNPQPSGELAAVAIVLGVADGGHYGTGGERADAGERGQALRRCTALGMLRDLAIELSKAQLELTQMLEQQLQATLHHCRQPFRVGQHRGQRPLERWH